jgi:hypothetical protein
MSVVPDDKMEPVHFTGKEGRSIYGTHCAKHSAAYCWVIEVSKGYPGC